MRGLLKGDAAFPAYIFFFLIMLLFKTPAVTRREEERIEHFSINTALPFIITCWYF